MSAAAFDTHAAVKKLQAAGFTESQAEAQAMLLAEALNQTLEHLKGDMRLDESATKRELKELELKLENRLADTKAELLKWVIGLLLAQTVIIAELVKVL